MTKLPTRPTTPRNKQTARVGIMLAELRHEASLRFTQVFTHDRAILNLSHAPGSRTSFSITLLYSADSYLIWCAAGVASYDMCQMLWHCYSWVALATIAVLPAFHGRY